MIFNLNDLISKLNHKRNLGGIIFGEAGIGKSLYINSFVERSNRDISYIDIQQLINDEKEYNIVFELDPESLIIWCLKLAEDRNAIAVIFDNFDVIVNLWNDDKINNFISRWVDVDFERSKFSYPKPLIAIMQTDKNLISAYSSYNSNSLTKINRFEDLEELL